MGRTALLFTEEGNEERISYFSGKMQAGRILINQPSSFGTIGDVVQFQAASFFDSGLRQLGRQCRQ